MTDIQVRDELVSALVGGTESPGTALAWAFHELPAIHSERPAYDFRHGAHAAAGAGPDGTAERG